MKYVLAILLAFSMFSCDDYLDINQNPNAINEEDIRPDLLLPGALNSSYRVQSRSMTILGNRFMQNWYGDVNNVTGIDVSNEYTLDINQNFYDEVWDGIYVQLGNFQKVIDYDSENYDNHKAIAYIMKSFYMQYIVDLWGDAPYSEAFQGQANLFPAYDDDKEIYRALYDNLDMAIAMFDAADANEIALGAEDIVYNGDIDGWKAFANTLKVKLLLRQSELTDAETVSYLAAKFAEVEAAGVYVTSDVTINPGYNDSTDTQMNPYTNVFVDAAGNFTTFYNQQRASGYIADFLNGDINGVVDNRRDALYETFGGNVSGAYQGANEFAGDLSKILLPMPSADSDGIIMSAAEAHFLYAEAAERGYLTSFDAETEFNAGIQASFNFLGASMGTYMTDIATIDGLGWSGNKIQSIMTQKWLATNSVNPIEAYIDLTRTGFPNLPLATTALYSNRPYRLQYPLSEFVSNSANVPSIPQAQLFQVGPFWKN